MMKDILRRGTTCGKPGSAKKCDTLKGNRFI